MSAEREKMNPKPQGIENILLPPIGVWVGMGLGIR
jgi:hypothetical protein